MERCWNRGGPGLRRVGSVERNVPCPVCKKPVEPRSRNGFFPFCSERCRRVDLGKWFGEEYRVQSRPDDGEELPPSPDDSSER